MAPKDLLRTVFHNIYRQKSMEALRSKRHRVGRELAKSQPERQPNPASPTSMSPASADDTKVSSVELAEDRYERNGTPDTIVEDTEVSKRWLGLQLFLHAQT